MKKFQDFANKICTISLMGVLVSCGAEMNSTKYSKVPDSLSQLEASCKSRPATYEPVTLEISHVYNSLVLKQPFSFAYIPPIFYDYDYPLVINLEEMQQDITRIKTSMEDEAYLQENATNLAVELFHLYNSSLRYEGQKCSINQLISQQKNDLRPFMKMRNFCTDKEAKEMCSLETFDSLTYAESEFVKDTTIKLCRTFETNAVNCEAQYHINSENRTIGELVNYYQAKFKTEKFDKLFSLRDTHLSFQCSKTAEDTTKMLIKVYSRNIPQEELEILTKAVAVEWTRNSFELDIKIVNSPGSDVVEITSVEGGTSYVPNNNNRLVFLSQSLNLTTKKNVLAHEFGHVLGFPDCYTEFYDNQNKDLIYYEMDKNNTNIMCSLKTGVSVPDDYLEQLAQKSCVFQ